MYNVDKRAIEATLGKLTTNLGHRPKGFLICPVRGHSQEETAEIVEWLEEYTDVHWPPRDTDQTDPRGLDICKQNRQAILEADVIFIIWNGESTGSIFDMGMAFTFSLFMDKIVIPLELPPETDHKSFQNMVIDWARENQLQLL